MQDALYSLLLALLASTLLLGSCSLTGGDDGGGETTPTDSTYSKATLNGEEAWSGKPQGVFYESYGFDMLGITVDTTHEQHYPYREHLGLDVEYERPGTYSLVRRLREVGGYSLKIGASYFEVDGDVMISSYFTTDDTTANRLTITRYDTTTGIMEGTFRTTVVIEEDDRDDPQRRRPDTLRFTDGAFRVEVEDRREE